MRIPDLDVDALRSFVTVADAGGFTAAGEVLGRTQSAISVKIKKLEDLVGRRLFERSSRSLALTADGELLMGYARRLLELNDEAVLRFFEPAAEGRLRLGVGEYFVPQHLPGLLRQFARAYPRVHIEVKVALGNVLLQALDQGELDIVITKCTKDRNDGRVIWTEPLLWACAHDFAPPADQPLPLCCLPPPCTFRESAIEALDRVGRPWTIVYSSESIMGVQAAASAGLGVTVLGRSSVGPELRVLGPADGVPPLGEVAIAVFGETPARQSLIQPLEQFILRCLGQLDGRGRLEAAH